MATGLHTTLETLASSSNDAANPVLLAALESPETEILDGAIRSILARRNKAAHLEVLKRWHQLSIEQRELLTEGSGRLSGALRDGVLSEDPQLFDNSCELVEQFKEFDLIPTLITLAENQKHANAEAATELVLRLVMQLSEMVHAPRDYQYRRDPQTIRRNVLISLERSLERFRTHNRTELIEAFVILAGPQSSVMREILDDPRHACYPTVIHALTQSHSAGVMELLLRTLSSEYASQNLLNVIGKRDDPEFVCQLLNLASQDLSPAVAKNIAKISSFAWLEAGERGYNNFNEHAQTLCIKLVAASGVKPNDFLDLLENVLSQGAPTARWAACDALAAIPGDRGNHLVLDAVKDEDPRVQASATRQLRDRHIPGAMGILLKQIDSPHESVRQASREALTEFSFSNFVAGFDTLNEEARRTSGSLVKKVDPQSAIQLLDEMESPSRKRRYRAVEVAVAMDLVPAVVDGLLLLLEDDDHMVRASAADALQHCPTGEVQTALRAAAGDRSGAVQSAAKSSLAVFDELALQLTEGTATTARGQQ